MELSTSAGSVPYVLKPFNISPDIRQSMQYQNIGDFTQGIAFLIWEDYNLEDYKDYLIHSKQYFDMHEGEREKFIESQLFRHADAASFAKWKFGQLYTALGFALFEFRTTSRHHKEVAQADMHLFKSLVQIENGILIDIILF
ncbi:hypothetical protein [Flavobacterium pectinovorum]|nr:hypothetical protein [Flavobacterium pectinovorum]OXB07740.1 hypothetical protein B0A72_02415 [Flavobacterium pectinovorum]